MGANAQTSVPVFTAGQVLTAQQQTEINTGIPVFATTTTRDAAFGGTGEKTLAEGQFAYIEASNTTQYYDGAAWQTFGGGLTLVKTQTIGTAVSSVTVTNAFSASYENYMIVATGGTNSGTSGGAMSLGATATGYYYAGIYVTYGSATVNGYRASNATAWADVINITANNTDGCAIIRAPFLAKTTQISYNVAQSDTGSYALQAGGFLNNTTSYTDFTITWIGATATGGVIRVYGIQNS